MEKEEYIGWISKLLNGQMRGAINKSAREENLVLIQLTMGKLWDECFENTVNQISDIEVLEKLKTQLKDDTDGS